MLKSQSTADKIFDSFNVMAMLLLIFVTLYPFWFVLVGSVSGGFAYTRARGVYWWPVDVTLANYHVVFREPGIVSAFRMAVFRAAAGTVIHLIVTSLFACAFSKKNLAGDPAAYALEYVENHLHEDLDMAQVASAVGLSYSHFSRVFKERTGEGFGRYLLDRRMRRARRMLDDPSVRASEVAYAVGYRNHKHFSRVRSNVIEQTVALRDTTEELGVRSPADVLKSYVPVLTVEPAQRRLVGYGEVVGTDAVRVGERRA